MWLAVASEESLEWSLGHAYRTLPERLQWRMAAVTSLRRVDLRSVSTIIYCVLRRFLPPLLHFNALNKQLPHGCGRPGSSSGH